MGASPGISGGEGLAATATLPKSALRPRPRAGFAISSECPTVQVLARNNPGLHDHPLRFKKESVSTKSPRIAEMIRNFVGGSVDPHYAGYFHCFNQGAFFEAHEVLEDLWLADRHGPNGAFYKGLIQLAGAFVHVQKSRLGPAVALLNLAEGNLRLYPALHEQLDVGAVLGLIDAWRRRLHSSNSAGMEAFPKLLLIGTPACTAPNSC